MVDVLQNVPLIPGHWLQDVPPLLEGPFATWGS